MADLKKAADDAAARAMIAAGKDAAKRALDGLLTSDEERAAKEAEQGAASKARRWKLIGIGVLGLLVLVGVVGMLLTYWHWFLLLGVLGLAGLYGWSRLKKRLASGKEAPKEIEATRVEAVSPADAHRVKEEARREEAASRARNAQALAEARAAEEQAVDEELAAMKARLKK